MPDVAVSLSLSAGCLQKYASCKSLISAGNVRSHQFYPEIL